MRPSMCLTRTGGKAMEAARSAGGCASSRWSRSWAITALRRRCCFRSALDSALAIGSLPGAMACGILVMPARHSAEHGG
jgi:hypothetical protein